jgi:hypothetical protein
MRICCPKATAVAGTGASTPGPQPRGSVACVTIYFDDFNDLNWAIGLWKSVRPREGKLDLN